MEYGAGTCQQLELAGNREEELKNLPHTEPVIFTLTEGELLEQLDPGYRPLKDDVYQRLEFHPSSFEVKVYHIYVYVSVDRKKFAKAKRPQANLFRNSIATPSLLASILNYKYVNVLPIHRLAQDFKHSEVNIPPQVMCNWVIKSSGLYFSLVYDWIKDALLKQSVIQLDETTLKVNRDGKTAGSSSYMWVYITGKDLLLWLEKIPAGYGNNKPSYLRSNRAAYFLARTRVVPQTDKMQREYIYRNL